MPDWNPASLTEQQRKWFASLREGLERETGRSLEAWAELARTCPETRHRARLRWLKDVHGLGQNRASIVLAEAFPTPPPVGEAQEDALWIDPAPRAILDAVAKVATGLDGVVTGRRKGYTAFSPRPQFAAAPPLTGGPGPRGLAVPPALDPRLSARGDESWSERLTAGLDLAAPEGLDAPLADLVRLAWERS